MTQSTRTDAARTLDASLTRLMTRYVEGDDAAFSEIYRLASPRLFSYLLRLTRNEAHAEDIVQVTFMKAHRSRDRYQPGAPVMPWLFTIARNSLRDDFRGLRARNESLTQDGTMPERATRPQAHRIDDRQELLRALGKVPRSQRDAVVLTKVLGLSVAEAAEEVGTTANSLKIRVHRGLKCLRQYAWA